MQLLDQTRRKPAHYAMLLPFPSHKLSSPHTNSRAHEICSNCWARHCSDLNCVPCFCLFLLPFLAPAPAAASSRHAVLWSCRCLC
jgi:hypothetical protein